MPCALYETKRLCIVTGLPGSGKSEFIDEIAEHLNMRHGWQFAYFSPENDPLAYHASKLIEKFTGKKFKIEEFGHSEYRQVKDYLENNFFFILPSDNFKLDNILEKAKYLVRKRGIKALVIDPYNRLESEQGTRSETLYISEMLDKLTNFAQMNDALVILMAHPTKLKPNADGKITAPTLYDISGSANFFNKADYGIVVHRNREENYVEVHIKKVKFKHLGEPGVCFFRYNLNNGRYVHYDPSKREEPVWNNTNHLINQAQEQAKKSEDYSIFDYPPDEDCPF
jgi:twinkle protein